MAVLPVVTDPVTVVATAILLLSSYVVYQRYFSPLASVPGPFWASLTPPSGWLMPISDKTGIHMPSVCMQSAGSKYWKGRWYKDLASATPDEHLFRMTNEPFHKERRRLIDPMYTLKSVRESEHLFDEPITFFVQQMRVRAGQTVDMEEWGTVFAIDAFTAVTYGKAFGLLEDGRSPEMAEFVDCAWFPYTWMVQLSFGSLSTLYQRLYITYKVIRSGGKPPLPILGWVGEQMEQGTQAAQQVDKPVTLLEKSLRVHREHPEKFTQKAINSHMFEIVFVGFETCGATIPKIMYLVASTDGCQERLRAELLQKATGSKGLAGLLKYDDLVQLPYLTACIHEGFRISPITGISLSRKVPKGGVTMNGFHLPEGTEIGITPWVTSYNKEIMPEPELYKPERWIEATPEQHSIMQGTDLFFGAGPAGCPGKTLANALMFKTLATIFSNFHVEAVIPRNQIKETNLFPVKWRQVMMKLTPLKKSG